MLFILFKQKMYYICISNLNKQEMTTAINYLKSIGIECDLTGKVLSVLPEGLDGINLIDTLQEATMNNEFCYTIINNQIEKIDC